MSNVTALLALADSAMQGTLATISSNTQRRQQAIRFLLPLGGAGILAMIYSSRKRKSTKPEPVEDTTGKGSSSTKKVAVNKVFFNNLKILLRICIPKWRYIDLLTR
jgi:hypothetical protein